jgi:hypothetical protein
LKLELICAPFRFGDLETTAKYLHLSQRHLQLVHNPLEELTLSNVDESRHAFRRPQKP